MSEYIYVIRPARIEMVSQGPNESELATLGRHGQYLDDLVAAGRIHLYGRSQNNDEQTFGIVVFDAANDEEAQQTLAADPAVAEGVMTGTVYPYSISYIRK